MKFVVFLYTSKSQFLFWEELIMKKRTIIGALAVATGAVTAVILGKKKKEAAVLTSEDLDVDDIPNEDEVAETTDEAAETTDEAAETTDEAAEETAEESEEAEETTETSEEATEAEAEETNEEIGENAN
jgi:uncharacterized membrane protein YukC